MPGRSKSPNSKKKMKELRESPFLKRFMNPALIQALGHPVREHVLAVTNERTVSGTEIARELETEVSTIFHIFEELEEIGFIEEVAVSPSRGKERFFRAKAALLIDEDGWEQVPSTVKKDLRVSIVRSIFDEVFEALRYGVLGLGNQSHVTWLPMVLDVQGRKEVKVLLDQTLARLTLIRRRSMARIMRTGEPGVPTTTALLAVETSQELIRPGVSLR